MSQTKIAILLVFFLIPLQIVAKTVRYELLIKNEKVNLSGKTDVDFALTVNGGIPAPTLEFTEGDEAEILVKNGLPAEEVSIHWHGILLPPEEDGVAYINTPPILPGTFRTFRFKIRQHGTYWYHSHTMLQEQKGVYGAFIIHPKEKKLKYDKDVVVVLSDWSDENADQILKNLKKDGDYYLYKKNSVRSWLGAIKAEQFKTYLQGEWERMGGMDLSDVGYDAFLINGKKDLQLLAAHPGERIRLRIINAAASSYFYVSLGQEPMKVISADGIDIEPVYAKEILMGMAETYDVLFTVPKHKNYELRATVQDITGFASGWIGAGEKVFAPAKAPVDLYAPMNHGSHSSSGPEHSQHGAHQDHSTKKPQEQGHGNGHGHHAAPEPKQEVVETLTVDGLKSLKPTNNFPPGKVHEVKLVLDGDMERYVWHINGKAIHEDRNIIVNEGDTVRFIYINKTMMHHPMHLHGHFFRVLNKNKEFSPLKHTVDVSPNGERVTEFYANEPGQWMLHCHNLYHMKTGMARVAKYASFVPSPEIAHHEKHDPHSHDHWYIAGLLSASTNQAELKLSASQTWNEIQLKAESLKEGKENFSTKGSWHADGDLIFRRWVDSNLNYMIAGSHFDEKSYGLLGVGYKLPLLIHAQLFVNQHGKFRLDLEKHFQWTTQIFSEFEYIWRPEWSHEDGELKFNLMYGPSWHWAAGLTLTNESLGVGGRVRF